MTHKDEITLHHAEQHIFGKPFKVQAENIDRLEQTSGGCRIIFHDSTPNKTSMENEREITDLFHGSDPLQSIERLIERWEESPFPKPSLADLRGTWYD